MKGTLDLHGIKHKDVQRMVDEFMWDQIQKKSSSVEIITGNSDQMKLVVKESLIDYNLNPYEEIFNQGKIIVKLN
jgi:DNA-nicking Smr family endonuclease